MRSQRPQPYRSADDPDHDQIEPPTEFPVLSEEPDEETDLDDFDLHGAHNDACWDVFIPDDDERDPLPEVGDFWGSTGHAAGSEEPD